MTDAEIAKSLLLGQTCQNCRHLSVLSNISTEYQDCKNDNIITCNQWEPSALEYLLRGTNE